MLCELYLNKKRSLRNLQEKEHSRSQKSKGLGTGAGIYGEEAQSLDFPMMVTQFDGHVLVLEDGAEWVKQVSGSKHPIFFFENTPRLYTWGHNEDTHSHYFCSESQKQKPSGDGFLLEMETFFLMNSFGSHSRAGNIELKYQLYHKCPRPCANHCPTESSPQFFVKSLLSRFCR